ncbi:MAG: L-threonylcarbamoyladenylate synthase [Firmicutes bacterium]|nr:L-threonylcarbamoyladenylate synthase [Bacillota bacterium]
MLRISINPSQPEESAVKQAANIIKNGGLVAFPTETVYGLGANALNQTAVDKIYAAKGRPKDNPLIWHVDNAKTLLPYVDFAACETIFPNFFTLIERLFEKSVTLVLPVLEKMSTENPKTLAVRVPQNAIAKALIAESSCIIAAPSANTSGKPSPTNANHVAQDLSDKIDMLLDGGATQKGLESTVISFCQLDNEKVTVLKTPQLLRPGAATLETINDIFHLTNQNPISLTDFSTTKKPLAPGMKYRHYSPNTPLILLIGTQTAVTEKINTMPKNIAVFRTNNLKLEKVAQTLFSTLRELDEQNFAKIVVEGVPETGLGLAIMNRLKKAATEVIIL